MNSLQRLLLFVLLGILLGFAAHRLCQRGPEHLAGTQPIGPSTTITREKVAAANTAYQYRIDSLEQVNGLLEELVQVKETDVKRAKYNYAMLQQLVDTQVNHMDNITDTAVKLAACDSLSDAVTEMIIAGAYKDNVYDSLVTCLKEQVNNQDSTIDVQRRQCQFLSATLDNTLTQMEQLELLNNQLRQAQHKQAVKQRFLFTGVAVLAGILSYNIIRH